MPANKDTKLSSPFTAIKKVINQIVVRSFVTNHSSSNNKDYNTTPSSINEQFNVFNDQKQQWLMALNNNQDIMYENDFEKLASGMDKAKVDTWFNQQLKQAQIIRTAKNCYLYEGNNPAQALDDLLNIKPLYIDCKSIMTVIDFLALRGVLGDEHFNELINKYYQGKLIIDGKLLPIYKTTLFCQCANDALSERKTLHLDQRYFAPGIWLYIFGAPLGFALHPTSEWNGYNMLWTEPNLVQGFSSWPSPPKTEEQVLSLMQEEYSKNLTYLDLMIISAGNKHTPHNAMPYNPYTYRQIYNLVQQHHQESITQEATRAKLANLNLLSPSNVAIPTSLSDYHPVGLCRVAKPDSKLFESFITSKQELPREQTAITNSHLKLINAKARCNHNYLSAEFVAGEHCSKELAGEINYFIKQCKANIPNKQPGGLILFGKKNTGKSLACQEAISILEQQGFKFWGKYPKQEALSIEQCAKMAELFDEDNEGAIATIIEICKDKWQTADIIFVDDLNVNSNDEHKLIAIAAQYFAKTNGKQLLITGKDNPLTTLFKHKPTDLVLPLWRVQEQ